MFAQLPNITTLANGFGLLTLSEIVLFGQWLFVTRLAVEQINTEVSDVEALHVGLHRLEFRLVPSKVHLRGEVVQIRHLAALGRVDVHVRALHRHKFVTRSLNHTHLLDARSDGSLLRLVARDDVAVPVQQDATASTQFLERAFHQLLSLLVTLVEVVRVLRQLLDVDNLFFFCHIRLIFNHELHELHELLII